ncbi:MAG: SDR family NAD(P)-dependent oxidoreductase [Chthoniobacterales bacterium]
MTLDRCCALVTGASAGIGREIARQLASRAHQLILVARRAGRLKELEAELRAEHPKLDIRSRPVDLSDPNELALLTSWLEAERIPINVLINNAGLGDIGPVASADPHKLQQIVLVNVNALTVLTRALLPQMLAGRNGAILNVSSCAGFLPIAGFAVYAASKAYVTAFSEALRAELRHTGITVTALCPGPVNTEFTDIAYRQGSQRQPTPEFVHVSATRVARLALEGLEDDKPLIIPGAIMKMAMAVVRLTPMPILRMLSRLSAKRT